MNPADGSSAPGQPEPMPGWNLALPVWEPLDPANPTAQELDAYAADLEQVRLDSIRTMEELTVITEARLLEPDLPEQQKVELREALRQATEYLDVLRG